MQKIVGTVQDAMKDFALRQKWSEKKKSNPLQKQREEELDPRIRQLKQMAEDDKKARTLTAIGNKLMYGQRLTKDELEYLRAHNPKEYEKAVFIEQERELYKEELKQCRSKEDVKKLKERHMMNFMHQSDIIQRSDMSEDDKKIALRFIQMRMAACENEFQTFAETGDYKKLPLKRRKEDEDDPAPYATGERQAMILKAKLEQINNPKKTTGTASVTATSTTEADTPAAESAAQAFPVTAGYTATGAVKPAAIEPAGLSIEA